jgi:hypothetical protein
MTERVSDLVMACVAENAAWCTLVARTHGIGTERAGGWVRTLRHAPAYQPDLITLDPTVTSAEVAEQLRDRPECSVKDSFGVLDLTGEGFERLFDAEWMAMPDPADSADPSMPTDPSEPTRPPADTWVESPAPAPRPTRVSTGWHPVNDVDMFLRWTAGLEADTALRPALLDDDDTCVWLLEDAGRTAGFIAHRSHHVVAVTNSFGDGIDDTTFWSDRIALANRGWGSLSGSLRVVCYERGDDIATAQAAGLEPHGALTVWIRTPSGRPGP